MIAPASKNGNTDALSESGSSDSESSESCSLASRAEKKKDGNGSASRSSDYDTSSGDHSDGRLYGEKKHDNEVNQVHKMSQSDTNFIRFWRIVVLTLLVIAGVAVSTATYIFLTNAQQKDYENRYTLFAITISDSTQFHLASIYQATTRLSEVITTTTRDSNTSFPFVTLPAFELHAYHARTQAGFESIVYAPLISQAGRTAWRDYSWDMAPSWLQESQDIKAELLYNATNSGLSGGVSSFSIATGNSQVTNAKGNTDTANTSATTSNAAVMPLVNGTITPFIYWKSASGENVPAPPPGPFLPAWQVSPPPHNPAWINCDWLILQEIEDVVHAVSQTGAALFTKELNMTTLTDAIGVNSGMTAAEHASYHNARNHANLTSAQNYNRPHTFMAQPVFNELEASTSGIVGLMISVLPWGVFVTSLLPAGVPGIFIVFKNNCGQAYTYVLNSVSGNIPKFLGAGDYHDPAYSDTEVQIPLYQYANMSTSTVKGHCQYSMSVYSSNAFRTSQTSDIPIIFTTIVAIAFLLVVVTFFVYDRFVQARNTKVVNVAARSNAIVSSLFPSTIRDRLFAESDVQGTATGTSGKTTMFTPADKMRSLLDNGDKGRVHGEGVSEALGYGGKPIADLFPETTVMFADIAGFTAWSSVREPTQVFTLLETVYKAFDEIAHRRRVFKVETVGDCYVAVTGLPEPQKDHAVIMCRFARDCMSRCRQLTKKLETTLGPDTGDLSMRIGIHSGQVTGGVLRGERSRFQLFGDTMNTASRMESTSDAGRVQVSQETADLLVAAGKSEWISLREAKVVAKGKGEMQTYWLVLVESNSDGHSTYEHSVHSSADGDVDLQRPILPSVEDGGSSEEADAKAFALSNSRTTRLIEWNVDVMLRLLKQIVARRRAMGERPQGTVIADEAQFELQRSKAGTTAIDEVKEIITLPKFDPRIAMRQEDPDTIVLSAKVVAQLYDFVSNIAAIYNDNPFHNFEHASHVTMSVVKLLSRIVAPSEIKYDSDNVKTGRNLHDHTYGITSDPLTQFACVFSALIHDADHSGVPNAQLVKEMARIADYYKGKSVAEQNSVDLAWHLLMDDSYSDLRATIYQTDAELKRFRQLVVNSVMATDIVDKELKTLRNARWAKAFSQDAENDTTSDAINRKATIVIEHLIQASDVAHTMQHWHIYRKWNERFFLECYRAYRDGRAEKNPSEGWYEGELGFYDYYIIPLARKLKDCGVFGVSSDEYLNYAIRNRKEWEERGREVVDEMVELVSKNLGGTDALRLAVPGLT